ncbi:thymosin beta-10-like [Meriones unguiculatus]|nr:thymosin beta-10-like [Meriones unguiculatus]
MADKLDRREISNLNKAELKKTKNNTLPTKETPEQEERSEIF